MAKNRDHSPAFLSFQNWCYEEGYKFVDKTEGDEEEEASFKYQGRTFWLSIEQEDETLFLNVYTGVPYEEHILSGILALNNLNSKRKAVKLYISGEDAELLIAQYHSFLEKGQFLDPVVVDRIMEILSDSILDAEIAVDEALEEAKKR